MLSNLCVMTIHKRFDNLYTTNSVIYAVTRNNYLCLNFAKMEKKWSRTTFILINTNADLLKYHSSCINFINVIA
jgi:hypothetical protein